MKFIWSISLVFALICFAGEALGMFGKSTEALLFESITNGDDAQAINAIDAPSKIPMKTYATNLSQTADIEIEKAVEITTADGEKISVKKFKKITPLILAVLLGRDKIVHKLVQEARKNRLIGHKMEATLCYIDKNNTPQELTVSAIECAQLCAKIKVVQYFIAKKIGTNLNIAAAREWIKGSLQYRLKTLQKLLTKLKEKLNHLRKSLQQLKENLTI